MSPSVAVRAGIPFGGGAFNPVNLPGLIWLLHFDDATDIIAGEINSVVCRKSGLTFSAPATTNRMPVNTTERPGHQVAQCAALNGDFLQCTDTPLAVSIGDGALSMFAFTRQVSNQNGFIMYHGSLSYNNGARYQWTQNSFAGNVTYSRSSGGALVVSHTFNNNWTYGQLDYDGTGVISYYQDNVLIGTASGLDANISSTFLNVKYGGHLAYFSLGGVVAGRNLTAAERADLFAYMQTKA